MTGEQRKAGREHTVTKQRKRQQEEQDGPKQSPLTWIIPLALLACLLILYFAWPGFRAFVSEAYSHLTSGSQQEIERWVGGFGVWGPVVLFIAMIMQALLAFIPSVLLMVVCVLAFGSVWGGLLAWAGVLIAAMVAYGIGRALGPVTVDRIIGHRTEQRISRYLERYGLWTVIAARISPVFSDDAVSYAAGLTGMRFYTFALATALGVLPLAGLIAFLGGDLGRLKWGLIVISVLSLAAIVAVAVREHHKGGKGKSEQSQDASD